MEKIKKCPNCGSTNDSIFTNCAFCNTPLPQIDNESISTETLVSEASKWVGYCYEEFINLKDPNNPTEEGIHYDHGQVRGIADQYINLLRVRSLSNPQLTSIVDNLAIKMEKNIKSRSKKLMWIFVGFIVGALVLLIIFNFERIVALF